MVGLVQATNGKLYGTTSGVHPSECNPPCQEDSTIFQITTAGTLETIYNYNASAGPQGLVQSSDGDLYGTDTAVAGSVFKITTTGTLTTLYSFCSLKQLHGRLRTRRRGWSRAPMEISMGQLILVGPMGLGRCSRLHPAAR